MSDNNSILSNSDGIWTGNTITGESAEQVYQKWKQNKELKPQPTEKETLLKEVADLKLDSIKKDSIISNALKTVADLKVKIISMEEGK